MHNTIMNRLTTQRRAQVIAALVEGNSIRSTVRMTGAAKNTVAKLLVDLGTACKQYQDERLRNLKCRLIQCDEIWSFCYCKEKTLPDEKRGTLGVGDVWTWVAIDADSKLAVNWLVGKRSAAFAEAFINDLSTRLAHRVQLTTDGHRAYLAAVEGAFGAGIDYAMLIKLYGTDESGAADERRYSPAKCVGCERGKISGNPDSRFISTSFIERQNLTMRMSMRRFTRLTNAFSKKIENLEHAVNLHYMYYNFARVHQTLRVTPAMEAGISNHIWSLEEIVNL
jgi:IS1 family transposase